MASATISLQLRRNSLIKNPNSIQFFSSSSSSSFPQPPPNDKDETTPSPPKAFRGIRDSLQKFAFVDDDKKKPTGTNQAEDKHKSYSVSGKTLAQTKKEQRWWYDPTIKYEALRRCAVPRYAYYDVSTTDWSDSYASASDSEVESETMAEDNAQNQNSEVESETMAEDNAQNQNNKVLAGAKEEELFYDDSYISYGIPKELAYSYISYGIPIDLAYSYIMYRIPKEIAYSEIYQIESETQAETESETETEIMTEAQTHREKILAGIKDDELFCYNPNIEYEPIKRYALPRFAFSDSSSTDWSGSSASSESESEMETKSMAKEEANSERRNP